MIVPANGGEDHPETAKHEGKAVDQGRCRTGVLFCRILVIRRLMALRILQQTLLI